jgi:hypothetical protein
VVTQNAKNYNEVAAKLGSNPKIGLIVNANNPMTTAELNDWTNSGHLKSYLAAGYENYNQLGAIFNAVSFDVKNGDIEGLVVTADPYFRSRAADFDRMLRDPKTVNFTGPVCYPFQEYVDNAAAGKNHTFRSKYMPLLATDEKGKLSDKSSYFKLGEVAASALAGTPKFFTWNGSTWQLSSTY